jgi:general secretion pathway protein D
MNRATRRCGFLSLFLILAACAAPGPIEEARRHFTEGRGEEALAVLEQATRANPNNRAARTEYFRVRDILLAQWLAQAETARSAGQLEFAEALYRRVQKYDPGNARAAAGLAQVDSDRRLNGLVGAAEQLVKAGKHREAQDMLQPVLAENPSQRDARRLQRVIDEKLAKPAVVTPELKPVSTKPISMELRDVTVRNVFEVLQRASGVNFVFDRDVRADQRTTIVLRNASLEDAVRLVLLTNQLEQRIINETTALIYPNTPQKAREYQELVVKGFYLANADVKQTANMVRTLVKTRDIFIDEKINLLVIKDTPAAIRLVERLIAAQDLAEPEVMLEVEVLEVATNRLLELGIRYPDTLAIGLQGAAGVPGKVTLREWRGSTSNLVQLTFNDPLFLFSLKQQDGITNVLANPRIRVKNKEKARVHIGDRVPVITTTAAATGGFISESVTYLDIGLKLEVEPLIYLDDDIGIKVGLEVSNIVREIRGASSNTLTYQVGTRNAATNLRLRDGETQVLAGLISDDDRRTADRVPGLGDLPIAGRLFSHTNETRNRTEIVLLITPRLQRTLARPEAGSVEFPAGTEASSSGLRLGGIPTVIPPITPPVQQPVQPVQPVPPAQPTVPTPGAATEGTQPGMAPMAPTMPQQPGAPMMVPFGGPKPPGQQ